MKKTCIIAALISFAAFAEATTINAPSALVGANLEGNNAYSWAISPTVPSGQTIDSATLTFSNVKLVAANSSGTGYLYTDLLKLGGSGVATYTDNDAAGDYFSGKYSNSSLGTQFFSAVGKILSFSYTFSSAQLVTLNSFITAGGFSIGLDPDCTYTIGGLCFTYTTSSGPGPKGGVPDTATTAYLLGAGLLGLEVLRRKFTPARQA